MGPARGGDGARRPPTDGAGELSGAFLQQAHDLGLLGGGAAAADHGRALARQLHELVLVVLEADLLGAARRVGRPRARPPHARRKGPRSWEDPPGEAPALTSRESPEMTRAQSCFLRKAFSSRWASPRLVTWKGTEHRGVGGLALCRTTNSSFLEPVRRQWPRRPRNPGPPLPPVPNQILL